MMTVGPFTGRRCGSAPTTARRAPGTRAEGEAMKFLVTYRERRADFDPAAAQRRAARLLSERAMPAGLKVHELLSRIGAGGGYAVVETAEAEDLQHLAGLFAAYDCRIEPVVDIAVHETARAPKGTGATPASGAATETRRPLPEMPASEPHEGAFSDDDVYDTED